MITMVNYLRKKQYAHAKNTREKWIEVSKCLITKKNNACIHTKEMQEIRAYIYIYCCITFFDKSNVKNVSFTVIIPLVISFSAVRFLIKISFHTIPLHYNLNVSVSLPLDQVRQTRRSSQCILEFTKYLRLRFFFRGISQRR